MSITAGSNSSSSHVLEMSVDSLHIDPGPSHPGGKFWRVFKQHEPPEHPDCLPAVGSVALATGGRIPALDENAVGVGRQFRPFEESEDEEYIYQSGVTR